MREVFKLDDELRRMILKGILDDLGEYHLTERLASSVVTTESAKVNFHIRDQAIQFKKGVIDIYFILELTWKPSFR